MNETCFLNIDLDIESTVDIEPILKEWGNRVCVLRNEHLDGIYYGSFETNFNNKEAIIEEYVKLIEGLSSRSREIWDNALKRDFDFGYQSGTTPSHFHSNIDSVQLNKLAQVGGNLVITIYPASGT